MIVTYLWLRLWNYLTKTEMAIKGWLFYGMDGGFCAVLFLSSMGLF
jgi:hypothetical protein